MLKRFPEKVQKIKSLHSTFLKIAKSKKTPLYIFDTKEAEQNLNTFLKAFKKEKTDIKVFYAIKTNSYIGLLKTIVKNGEGLDASSPRELKLALKAGAKRIIYTGPAKQEDDFKLILKHHKKITINLESVRELKLLSKLASKEKKQVRCGLRVVTKSQDGWTKFGLPLNKLKDFYLEAQQHKYINFCGIHFHISMNKNPQPYINTFKEITAYLQKNFSAKELENFEYLDMGGGFYPQVFEEIHSWNPGQSIKYFDDSIPIKDILNNKYKNRGIAIKVEPLEKFAKAISQSWQELKKTIPKAELYCEPGRFICHSTMHILLKLVDIKTPQMGITDGGGNMIGWEKYQFFNYVPLFNLSSFSTNNEIPFITYGSLCTPDDIWGYYLYTKNQPQENNIILMPFQGAYTFTLAQEFIKDIPPVIEI